MAAKSKASMMAALEQRRRDAGLVSVSFKGITPDIKQKLIEFYKSLSEIKNKC